MNFYDHIVLVDRLRALPTETEWLEFKQSVQPEIADRAERSSLQAVVHKGVSALLRISDFDDSSKGFSKGDVICRLDGALRQQTHNRVA